MPRLPGGTACDVLVAPRAFLVLTTSLESVILLCAWQRLGVVPFYSFGVMEFRCAVASRLSRSFKL